MPIKQLGMYAQHTFNLKLVEGLAIDAGRSNYSCLVHGVPPDLEEVEVLEMNKKYIIELGTVNPDNVTAYMSINPALIASAQVTFNAVYHRRQHGELILHIRPTRNIPLEEIDWWVTLSAVV